MKIGKHLVKLIGEHECLMFSSGNEDFVSSKAYLFTPAIGELMTLIAHDLNRANLKGRHTIRIRMDCHAQPRDEEV